MSLQSTKPETTDVASQFDSALSRGLEAISRAVDESPKLFPNGITTVEIEVKLPGSTGFTVKLSGPEKGAPPKDTGVFSDHLNQRLLVASSVDDLDLAPKAKAGAQSLTDRFGAKVVFTSGRRSVDDQCRAMAQNIVSTTNRKWIEKTYKASAARTELQGWIDANPAAITIADLTAGLVSVMSGWNDAKKATITLHLSGAAFDIQPVSGADGDDIKSAIGQLDGLRTFLDGEAGVKVWHVDFNE